jgi:hypothetical protein
VRFSFPRRIAQGDFLDCIRQIVGDDGGRKCSTESQETFQDNRLPAVDLRPSASAKSPPRVVVYEGISQHPNRSITRMPPKFARFHCSPIRRL